MKKKVVFQLIVMNLYEPSSWQLNGPYLMLTVPFCNKSGHFAAKSLVASYFDFSPKWRTGLGCFLFQNINDTMSPLQKYWKKPSSSF
jgi:hypothetical protein